MDDQDSVDTRTVSGDSRTESTAGTHPGSSAGLSGTFAGPTGGDGAANDVDPGAQGAEETGGIVGPHAAGDHSNSQIGTGGDAQSGVVESR